MYQGSCRSVRPVRSEIENAEPDGVSPWFPGCNGFVVRSAGTTVYLDPCSGDSGFPRVVRTVPVPMNHADATTCDAVLATHEHASPLLNGLGAGLYAPSAAYTDPG